MYREKNKINKGSENGIMWLEKECENYKKEKMLTVKQNERNK